MKYGNVMSIMSIILIAVSYYLFSNEFIRFSAAIKGRTTAFFARFIGFLIVYVWFIVAGFLELPLVVNWLIYMVILGLEVHFIFRFDFLVAYALSLSCVITGLAVNVCFRCFAAILMNVPLSMFDKNYSDLKVYPIFFGFLAMALLLYILRRIHFTGHLKVMLHYRKSLVFYTCTEAYIYLFLIILLLAYSQSGNTLGIKIWGIKSALFSIVVLMIAIIYSLRVASLQYYVDKQHEISEHLIEEKKDVNKLWQLAYTDMLTGCQNRHLLDKRLEEYAAYGTSITLAFIDVNGLKKVNDQYGHVEGDRYLADITRLLSEAIDGHNIDLFRYGGDEFVMMSNTVREEEITGLLARVNEQLALGQNVYMRSVSYGAVHGDCTDYPKLIAKADELMYKHKLEYYGSTVRA